MCDHCADPRRSATRWAAWPYFISSACRDYVTVRCDSRPSSIVNGFGRACCARRRVCAERGDACAGRRRLPAFNQWFNPGRRIRQDRVRPAGILTGCGWLSVAHALLSLTDISRCRRGGPAVPLPPCALTLTSAPCGGCPCARSRLFCHAIGVCAPCAHDALTDRMALIIWHQSRCGCRLLAGIKFVVVYGDLASSHHHAQHQHATQVTRQRLWIRLFRHFPFVRFRRHLRGLRVSRHDENDDQTGGLCDAPHVIPLAKQWPFTCTALPCVPIVIDRATMKPSTKPTLCSTTTCENGARIEAKNWRPS